MSQLLKNLKISGNDTNVRLLKLPLNDAHSIISSLNKNNNLSFVYKPSFAHSFSVYPHNNLSKEYFRISFPIQYKSINDETNISEYINNNNNNIVLSPYIILLLGQGKSCIGYFNINHEMTDWREISRIIQCKNIIKLKYPKQSPVFITDANLTRFYKEVIYKSQKWSYALHKKLGNEFNINNVNIAWMADDKIWSNFWKFHEKLCEKENEGQHIMPFHELHSNLMRIGEYGMGYPKKSDLTRFSYELREFYCYIDNDVVEHEYFPKEIKDLMMDKLLCWDPMKPDITEQRNKKGKRKLVKLNDDDKEIEEKPWLLKEKKKMRKKMKTEEKYQKNRNKYRLMEYEKESEKLNDLEKLMNNTPNNKSTNTVSV